MALQSNSIEPVGSSGLDAVYTYGETKDMRVCAIVPSYNSGATLAELLEKLKRLEVFALHSRRM